MFKRKLKRRRLYKLKTIPATNSAADMIKETMDYYHIPISDLANRLGISDNYLEDILSKKKYMTPSLASHIEEVMGLSSELLLNLDLAYINKHQNSQFIEFKKNNPLYLKKYDWVSTRS